MTVGTTVSPTDPLADDALLALARQLHAALGCTWIALTPVQDGQAAGPRRLIELPATLRTTAADHLPRLLALAGRLLRLPDDVPLLPAGCMAYRPCALDGPAGPVGLLELGWNGPAPVSDEAPPPDLLTLAALLADDRLVRDRLQRELPYLRGELRAGGDLRTLTGDGPAMRAVRQAIGQVARTDSTVLILGETGTGKELVARAIHQLSPRRDRLLVAVNGAALAPGVVASELFGHEAGAFTGAARRRIGRFELAHRGTLFLDEIAELAPEIQAMLLRVLQERAIERVGGSETVPVDVRLIAATHQDLARAVTEDRFRADLFYRLNVFPIQVPPLRDRREDIPDLVRHFIHHFNRRMGKQVTAADPESLRLLAAQPWPGNVRELENLVERAMIVSAEGTLRIDPSWLPAPSPADPPAIPARLQDVERQSIVDALRRSRGRIYGPHGAAALLGVKPTTLYGKMRKHGIRRDAADV